MIGAMLKEYEGISMNADLRMALNNSKNKTIKSFNMLGATVEDVENNPGSSVYFIILHKKEW